MPAPWFTSRTNQRRICRGLWWAAGSRISGFSISRSGTWRERNTKGQMLFRGGQGRRRNYGNYGNTVRKRWNDWRSLSTWNLGLSAGGFVWIGFIRLFVLL